MIKKLEAENKLLKAELAELKSSINALTAKVAEQQKDLIGIKLVTTGLNNTLTSVQNDITQFTTVTFPKHYHLLKGYAGNAVKNKGPVELHTPNIEAFKLAMIRLRETSEPLFEKLTYGGN